MMDDMFVREWLDTIPHIEDDLRSAEMALKAKARKPRVSIQVINMTCHCGGFCVNSAGSTMIEATDFFATCEACGETFQLLRKYFIPRTETKKEQ